MIYLFEHMQKYNNDNISKYYIIFEVLIYQILIFDLHIFEMNQEKDNMMVILYNNHEIKINNQMWMFFLEEGYLLLVLMDLILILYILKFFPFQETWTATWMLIFFFFNVFFIFFFEMYFLFIYFFYLFFFKCFFFFWGFFKY